MINPEFWRGKRVFITGHTGFKGTWLSLWLKKIGADVTGFALPPPTSPSLFELTNAEDGLNSIVGDIRDLHTISDAVSKAKPQIVFHMAAQPLVRLSYKLPVETYATNVMGTVNVLEAIRQSPSVEAAVIVTTDKCYENKEWVWGYRENEPMGGHDPYSNSKGCAELVVSAYRNSFFSSANAPKIASARAGNVIGGGDFAEDRLIPDIVRAAIKSEKLIIRNPNSIRPWQHVLEPLSGYMTLAERLCSQKGNDFAEGWNFGPVDSDSLPVRQIVEAFLSDWNSFKGEVNFSNREEPHEANLLKLDISKARHRLNWKPVLNIQQAIAMSSIWYKKYAEGTNNIEETLNQIQQYEKLRLR